jgi:hypothetical protein
MVPGLAGGLEGADLGITGLRGVTSGDVSRDVVFGGGGSTVFDGGDTEFAGARPAPPRGLRRGFPVPSPLSQRLVLCFGKRGRGEMSK